MRNPPSVPAELLGLDIRNWPMPRPESIAPRYREGFGRRCNALNTLAGGASVRQAAKQCGVHRDTVAADARRAMQTDATGQPLGYFACLPCHGRRPATVAPDAPERRRPYAFQSLLAAVPGLADFVGAYRGALPTGRYKCRAFDRFHGEFLQRVRAHTQGEGYPFDVRDKGRRALLRAVLKQRQRREAADASPVPDPPAQITRLAQVFRLAPLDRVEFDAHTLDLDHVVEVPHPTQERLVPQRIGKITLLALIDAVSRYLISYLLLLGTYTHLDVLRLFHRALRPWRPRELQVPGMSYAPGAVLGLPVSAQGVGVRALLIAGDNARQHHARTALHNVISDHGGVLNFGRSHVPEARPIIEAFFRRLEEGALRHLPGAFQPRPLVGPLPTAYGTAEGHPLHWEALNDLIDVIAAGHNVTPHSGIGQQRPVEVLNTYLDTGGWVWASAGAAQDAARITTQRVVVTVRGGGKSGKAPYVQWQQARYRSHRLVSAGTRVAGRKFQAEVDLEDLRFLNLLENGQLWSPLRALPPWDRTAHDLTLRRHILGARERGLIRIDGAVDAVAAYTEFTHARLASGDEAAPTTRAGVAPMVAPSTRGPAVSLSHFKD